VTSTLSEMLLPAAVDLDSLYRRYRPLLEIVRKLTGVVPNACAYLEIWPTAFRTYNVLVPHLLNLPFLLFYSRARKGSIGLAMYAASRAAGCAYCSAHCCSFALRRGADTGQVRNAHERHPPSGIYTAPEGAAIAVATALGRIPSTLTPALKGELSREFSAAEAEWLVLSIATMGFLNKFNDAVGVPLEDRTYSEVATVIGRSGWTPGKHRAADTGAPLVEREVRAEGLRSRLAIVPLLPSIVYRDIQWTRGTPASWPSVGFYLRDLTGHDFPVLANIKHARAIRAIATAVRDNCDAAVSKVGLHTKHLAGLVYARLVEDQTLANAAREMAAKAGATRDEIDGSLDHLDRRARTATMLAEAAASSPARIGPELVARIAADLSPAETVELITWLSVLQLLHRLVAFYA
jgi:alkylhydroperoxidase family enzyme